MSANSTPSRTTFRADGRPVCHLASNGAAAEWLAGVAHVKTAEFHSLRPSAATPLPFLWRLLGGGLLGVSTSSGRLAAAVSCSFGRLNRTVRSTRNWPVVGPSPVEFIATLPTASLAINDGYEAGKPKTRTTLATLKRVLGSCRRRSAPGRNWPKKIPSIPG